MIAIPIPGALAIATNSLPTGIKDSSYSGTLQATGGTPPYTWSLAATSNPLPRGLALNSSTGQVTGTPTDLGTTSVTFEVRDSAATPATLTKALNLEVVELLVVTTTSLPDATQGVAYNATLQASGGKSPITWSIVGTNPLPGIGLALNSSTGVISGTPTTSTTVSFTARATDASSTAQTSDRSLALTVAGPLLTITTTSLPGTTGGKFYNFTLASIGGTAPITWAIDPPETPPTGITLDAATGRLSGLVDLAAPTQTFTVRATDSTAGTPQSITRSLTITVQASLGRNDNVCPLPTNNPTPISNGTIRASLSPYGDIDVYSFQGTAGARVTIETVAQRLELESPPNTNTRDSFADTVVELLDGACNPLTFNDDIDLGIIQDSLILNFPLPAAGTFFLRVRDFRGDGRADFIYDLRLTGAN